jgi:hypothetical protein
MRHGLHLDVKRCMVDILKACAGKLLKKSGYFDLFGLDFMVTCDNEMLLLEANTNPALALDNECMREILPPMVDGCLEIVTNVQGPARQANIDSSLNEEDKKMKMKALDSEFLSKGVPDGWDLLMDESRKWYYNGPHGKSVWKETAGNDDTEKEKASVIDPDQTKETASA